MATLTIKNLPDALYQRLRARAASHRRSINQEAIVCLEAALATAEVDEVTLLEHLRLLREQSGVYLTDDTLKPIIEEGRM